MLFFAPGTMLWLVLLALGIKGVGASLINTLMFGLEADTVEYGEWQTGRRSEGATYALFAFTPQMCQSIGGALGAWAWALAFGGYIAASTAGAQPGTAGERHLRHQDGHCPAAGGRGPHRHDHLHQVTR
jgi:glucuronide carrier protein